MRVARIIITRKLVKKGLVDHVVAVDANGDVLPLTEALGMLRLAEDTIIRERMEGEED